ncbi:hypothetical protein ACFQYP_57450 [Nonomuraea antimicrobica]
MEIWHNPRCSKSRTAKAALDAAGTPTPSAAISTSRPPRRNSPRS